MPLSVRAPSAFPKGSAFPSSLFILALAGGFLLASRLTGCGGSDSTGPEKPTVSLTAPLDGATVSGAVLVEAAAAHCDRVSFHVDAALIGEDAAAPYSVSWNSGTVANGTHVLKVRAEGGGGSAEATVSVTVNNAAGTVVVSVSPAEATVSVGQTQQFTVIVTGTSNTAVNWSVDQGVAWGTVSASGLYTAPAARPSPATATVRATSQADPTKSGTATVTLTGGSGGGISAEEKALSHQAYWVAQKPADLATEAVKLGAEAVWGASELKGSATLTGTLTQSAPNSDNWTYSSNPTDRLVVAFAGGPTVEFAFSVFEGYTEGTWEQFLDRHNLDFTARISGQYDVRVQSQIGFVGGAESPYTWKTQWQRRISGTALYEGATTTLDVTESGTQQGFTESGWAGLETVRDIQGQASSPTAQFSPAEHYWTNYIHNGSIGRITRNWLLRVNSSVTAAGVTYKYDAATARWECSTLVNDPGAYNVATEPDYWMVSGRLLRNGQAFGDLAFDGPVVKDTNGPSLILRFNNGETLLLHTLAPDPGE